jgi:hypothetical protein
MVGLCTGGMGNGHQAGWTARVGNEYWFVSCPRGEGAQLLVLLGGMQDTSGSGERYVTDDRGMDEGGSGFPITRHMHTLSSKTQPTDWPLTSTFACQTKYEPLCHQ